jgi:hypothetical protein
MSVKLTNVKFHENPLSGSRVATCGETDMTKPISAFFITSQLTRQNIVTVPIQPAVYSWTLILLEKLIVAQRLNVSACYLLHAGFLLGLLPDLEDGGYMFLRNVG